MCPEGAEGVSVAGGGVWAGQRAVLELPTVSSLSLLPLAAWSQQELEMWPDTEKLNS